MRAFNGAEMSWTYSNVPLAHAASCRAADSPRISGSRPATVRGVKALFTSRRAKVCRGGSVVPRVRPIRSGRSLRRLPRRCDDHTCGSENAAMQSSNRVSTQMSSTGE